MFTNAMASVGSAAIVLALAASASASNPQFVVSGSVTAGNPRGDLFLDRVVFADGTAVESGDFRYVSRVRNFSFGGHPNEIRIVSGVDATPSTVSGFHRLEEQDGNRGSISPTDLERFNGRIFDAWQGNNLNNYVDMTPGRPMSMIVEFDRPVRDNSAGRDDVGELLYFERGHGGSNSWLLIEALDDQDRRVGRPALINPRGSNQPIPLASRSDVSTHDSNGRPGGAQTMEGLALDLSEALGVDWINRLRISTPTKGQDGFNGTLGQGDDLAPDFKFLAVPAPSVAGVLALAGLAAARRRRS